MFYNSEGFKLLFCNVQHQGIIDIKYHFYLSSEEGTYMTLRSNDRSVDPSIDKNIYSIIGTHNMYKK